MKESYIKKLVIILTIVLLLLLFLLFLYNNFYTKKEEKTQKTTKKETTTQKITEKITLSFAGDCTLGNDDNFGYKNSLNDVFSKNNGDYSYFFRNVKSIFENDDLSVVNLETTLTTAKIKNTTTFNFKGDPGYTNILKEGDIEVVNLANNHIKDYLEQGYTDTKNNLINASIDYYGYEKYIIKEIKGIKIGIAGFTRIGQMQHTSADVKKALDYFIQEKVDIKIITFHWGMESQYKHNYVQENLGKQAIDDGADIVIGHHVHVVQGIQRYKDKLIIYSLGNFIFGGNSNPKDKDSFILQVFYNLENKKVMSTDIKIIPVSISSKTYINDYQPYIFEGLDKQRVIDKINRNSKDYIYQDTRVIDKY